MIDFFGNIFSFLFGTNSRLATMIIAMFPIIELKGAIPVGMSIDFWGENALPEIEAFVFSLIGSCLVVPIIALIFLPIINYLKRTKLFKKLALAIEDKVVRSSKKINNKVNVDVTSCNEQNITQVADRGKCSIKRTFLKMLGVWGFVALPLPLTGVWTGTCIAVSVGLNFWQTVLSVVSGNIVAGLLVMFVCSVFPNFTSILFLIVLAIVIVILFASLCKVIMQKKTKQ